MQRDRKLLLIALGIILIMAVWGGREWSERDEAHRLDLKRAGERYKKREDSLVNAINRKDETILKYMREGAEKDMIAADAVLKANRAINETKRIKRITTHSDAQRDSLLQSVLGN